MIHFTAFVLGLLSFGGLALATERHQQDVCGRMLARSTTRWLRAAGWMGLTLALSVLVQGLGWAMGLVGFSGHTSLSAGLVYLALIVHARRIGRSSGKTLAAASEDRFSI